MSLKTAIQQVFIENLMLISKMSLENLNNNNNGCEIWIKTLTIINLMFFKVRLKTLSFTVMRNVVWNFVQ